MQSPENKQWSLDASRELYSIAHWSEGYFLVDDHGQLCMRPRAGGPALARLDRRKRSEYDCADL